MPANLGNSTVTTGLEKVSFHSNPKKGKAKECSNYLTIAFISHANKILLKILQVRHQQYVNHELPDIQAGFRQRSNCQHLLDHREPREFQKNIYFCFIDYAKAFDCVDHNRLWKILQERGLPDHLHASWEICVKAKKQQLELDMEQLVGSKLGKE